MRADKFCQYWERFQVHSPSEDTTVYEILESVHVALSWRECHSFPEVLGADAQITTQASTSLKK